MNKKMQTIEEATILFAGDSGDGSQIIGTQMTEASAIVGNDVATLPDYPAEIRAPAGSLAGISGFQLHFSSENIHTPGDACDVLVAMNPAALKVNIDNLKSNGLLIVNSNNFASRNLKLAGYDSNPLEDGSLEKFQVYPVELTRLTREALKDTDLSQREVDRCKNFFAVGMVFWLYNRPMANTLRFIKERYAEKPQYVEANTLALKAGNVYCEATEQFATSYVVEPAEFTPGKYRNVEGNMATAFGLVARLPDVGFAIGLR